MMLRKFHIVGVAFGTLCLIAVVVAHFALGAEGGKQQPELINVKEIMRRISVEEGKGALLQEFQDERKGLIVRLVGILEDTERSRPERIQAARLLGCLRAAEATQPLIENVSLAPEVFTDMSWNAICPCGAGLIQIGKPASKAAVDAIARGGDEGSRCILASVITRIEGADVARFMLQQKLAGAQAHEQDSIREILTYLGEMEKLIHREP